MLLPLLAIAIVIVAGCGGARPTGATQKPGSTTATQATQKPGAQVDCAAMKAAAAKLIGIQLLAQLATPESVASIKSLGNLDLDAMLSALDELHALDSFAGPLGDPKASLDTYEAAATAAKAIFEMDPVTQAALDAYNKDHVGTVGEFLAKQIAISGALDEAGC
jgi:hypothetical protein